MNTEADLWKHLTDNPQDSSAKLALADLLQEKGQEDLSWTLRWCVKWKCWPSKGPKGQLGGSWSWLRGGSDELKRHRHCNCTLPRTVFSNLTSRNPYIARNAAGTLMSAVGKLNKALVRLRILTQSP